MHDVDKWLRLGCCEAAQVWPRADESVSSVGFCTGISQLSAYVIITVIIIIIIIIISTASLKLLLLLLLDLVFIKPVCSP